MCRPTSSKKTRVALKIKVELGRMDNVGVDGRACRTVPGPIRLALREEPDVVALADDDDGQFGERADSELLAGPWKMKQMSWL